MANVRLEAKIRGGKEASESENILCVGDGLEGVLPNPHPSFKAARSKESSWKTILWLKNPCALELSKSRRL